MTDDERCPDCSFQPTNLADYCDKHKPGPTNLIRVDPVARSSTLRGRPFTARALVVTRGRDRSWIRSSDVLYLEAHARTREARKTFPKPTAEIAITYDDAARLIAILQKEIDWHRKR
jgi:hypothetical protein